jgi:hypothetical protein
MKSILMRDSIFLKEHCLIDYSVFLVEVDRQKMLSHDDQFDIKAMVYDALEKSYVMKESKQLKDDMQISGYIK